MKALLAALAVSAFASEPSPLFDGSAGPVILPAAAPAKLTPLPRARPPATQVPPDLAAASARVGNAAMLARVASRAADESFTFGVIGDAEPGRFWWERMYSPGRDAFSRLWSGLASRGPDFVLQLGDFVSEGDAAHYRDYARLVESLPAVPLLRCVGNHDRSRPNGEADKALYDAVIGSRDYFFDHGGWRFVSLDSSDRKVTAAQLGWLRAALSVPGPKIVFTHVPPSYLKKTAPLAAVGALEDGEEDEKGYLHDFLTNYFDDGAAEFERLVVSGGVKAVYLGHIHAFWAADRGGVRYVISGGGGSPLYPLPPGYPKKKFAHSLWVRAYRDGRLEETVAPLDGAPFILPVRGVSRGLGDL